MENWTEAERKKLDFEKVFFLLLYFFKIYQSHLYGAQPGCRSTSFHFPSSFYCGYYF